MLDISFLLYDPDFCTLFTLVANSSEWINGRHCVVTKSKAVTGVARPTSGDDLEMLPEADRVSGSMTFLTKAPMRFSDGEPAMFIEYQRKRYKIIHADDFNENGFYKAIATYVEVTDDA